MFDISKKELKEQICLDFANTVDWHASAHPIELLHHYRDLIQWCLQHEILSNNRAEALQGHAERIPELADQIYREALVLREAIYAVFSAYVHLKPVDEADLVILNRAIGESFNNLRICRGEVGFVWDWVEDESQAESLLWPIIHSAASLLTTPHLLERVGQCADERGCGWLFLDLSKNHSRRWCDIKDCGNVAKQRRHYRKGRLPQELHRNP